MCRLWLQIDINYALKDVKLARGHLFIYLWSWSSSPSPSPSPSPSAVAAAAPSSSSSSLLFWGGSWFLESHGLEDSCDGMHVSAGVPVTYALFSLTMLLTIWLSSEVLMRGSVRRSVIGSGLHSTNIVYTGCSLLLVLHPPPRSIITTNTSAARQGEMEYVLTHIQCNKAHVMHWSCAHQQL